MKAKRVNRGTAWEAVLNRQHQWYAADGRASIEKIENPWKALGPPRQRTGDEARHFGSGGPVTIAHRVKGKHVDFVGILRGGKAVRLEAKSSRATSISLRAVEEHQARSLSVCDRLGGVAMVAVLTACGLWIVPWLHWVPARHKNGKLKTTLDAEALDARGARLGDEDAAAAILAGGHRDADWLRAAAERGWT